MQETEKRLKDIVAGKRQAGPLAVANGAARKGPAGKQRQTMLVFTVRWRQTESGCVRHDISENSESCASRLCRHPLPREVLSCIAFG